MTTEEADVAAPATAGRLDGVRVCMVLYNAFTHDARVLKEGRSMLAAGADVRVVAHHGHGLPSREVVDGLRVVRAPLDPLPSRAARWVVARRRRAPAGAPPVELPPRPAPAGRTARWLYEAELAARRVLVGATYAHWYRQVLREALREPFDVVVAHDFEALPAAWILARRTGAGLLYDAHELAAEQGQIVERTAVGRLRQRLVEGALARRAGAVMTVNDSLADELARRYRIRRPHVVRNVPYPPEIVAAHGEWRQALDLPEGTRVVLYLGGLFENRGLEDLIAAVARLQRVAAVCIGPAHPGYRERLRGVAAAAGVADRVHLLPPVAAAEVPAYAAAADVGVLPFRRASLNLWWSLPNKLFEYLAAGLPIVTVAFPELVRVVERYDVGRVCPCEDPAALADAIRAVLDDPAELERLRGNVARAAAELTWHNEEPRLLTAVEQALATSR